MVKEFLRQREVDFKVRDVIEDPAAMTVLRELGYRSLPVTMVGEIHVHGADLEKLEVLLQGA